jgi:inner membrane protein involved in colicin E2 resistance
MCTVSGGWEAGTGVADSTGGGTYMEAIVMVRRIVAIIFIFGCTTVGWMILGGVTTERSYQQGEKLEGAVWQLWGAPMYQVAPSFSYQTHELREVTRDVAGTILTESQKIPTQHLVPLEGSQIDVDLRLEHRQRGLIWYPTYEVRFDSKYLVENKTGEAREMTFAFGLPSSGSVYDDFHFMVDGKEVADIKLTGGSLTWPMPMQPGEKHQLSVSYKTRGVDVWQYRFGNDVTQVKNFILNMHTDFDDIDFPVPSMSPTTKEKTNAGWLLSWRYTSLLSGVQIGMVMPGKLNPGPWAARITFFAPVSLLFFFFLLFIFTTVNGIRIHPMNYFFLGAGFFSFHLLLAYLVDHISIHLAFIICSVVSIFLVVSYMRLVVGSRFALMEVGISQFIYLVGFSYTFFFEGATGLSVTLMCIATLFVVMQYTGRLDWEKVFKDASSRLQNTTA